MRGSTSELDNRIVKTKMIFLIRVDLYLSYWTIYRDVCCLSRTLTCYYAFIQIVKSLAITTRRHIA